MTPIFSRSWLVKMTAVFELDDGAGQLAQRLAHQPGLQAHDASRPSRPRSRRVARARPPSRPRRTSMAPERTSVSTISSACSPVSGWETSSSSTLTPQAARVAGIERVLHVDEGARRRRALRLGDDVLAEGRLARRFRPVDLGDAAARDTADAQRQVERDRAGGDRVEHELVARPRASWGRAATELLLDRTRGRRQPPCLVRPVRSAARSSVIAICSSRSSSDHSDRLAGADHDGRGR